MDRRGFVRTLRDGVSSSFLVGGLGGAVVGGGAVGAYVAKDRLGRTGRWSYAQQGEDLVVENVLGAIGVKGPITYLDIGAFDPVFDSNTFAFYEAGGHGVLVEPNPSKIDRLKSVRPRDKTLNVGVGLSAEPTTGDYYVIGGTSGGLLNTFSKEDAEDVQTKSHGQFVIEKVLKLPLVNINMLMREQFAGAPNFLSIDTEGLDFGILKTMDFDRYRPDVICVETLEVGGDAVSVDILRLLESKRYSARGATFVNTIFVDDRHLSKPGPLTAPLRSKT
ncbi:MAG TPA: FkbM family methyltransferase [Polyangia bacterium]|nr:FkbM family methyltransferase [Polyangia bacterium]